MTHDDRVTGLLQANNHMVELCRALKAQLRKNHATFKFYEQSHRAKKTPDADAKAEANLQHAQEIEALLAQH